jgi:hypothetical protein
VAYTQRAPQALEKDKRERQKQKKRKAENKEILS